MSHPIQAPLCFLCILLVEQFITGVTRNTYEYKIREYFQQFKPLTNITGRGLSETSLARLEESGWKIKLLRKQ